MDKILRPKYGGKTTELIKRSAETGFYIVCLNNKYVDQVERHAQKMGLKIPQPITAVTFFNGRYYGPGVNGLLIDDVDIILQQVAHAPIQAITLTSAGISLYQHQYEEVLRKLPDCSKWALVHGNHPYIVDLPIDIKETQDSTDGEIVQLQFKPLRRYADVFTWQPVCPITIVPYSPPIK